MDGNQDNFELGKEAWSGACAMNENEWANKNITGNVAFVLELRVRKKKW